MSTLTVEVNTGTDASPTWTTVDADQAEIVKRRGRGGYATFRVPDADVTDRTNLRVGRMVRLKLYNGTDTVWFKGPLLDPRVISEGAGVFSIEATVAELAEAAKYKNLDDGIEYPTDLDSPTITEFSVDQDAYVDENDPDTNFGSSAVLKALRSSTPSVDLMYAFLQFDISSITSTDVITDAYLRLLITNHAVEGDVTATAQIKVSAHTILDSWAEDTVTWTTKPDIDDTLDTDTNARDNIAVATPRRGIMEHYMTMFNLQEHFRAIHAGTLTNNGLALVIAPDDGNFGQLNFASSEDTTSDNRPKLVIYHHSAVLVSDVVEDLFTNYWDDVDITGIQATTEFVPLQVVRAENEQTLDHAEGIRFDRFDSLYDAMELLTGQVTGWQWWLDTSDGDDVVLYFQEVDTGAATGIGESDVLHPFEMEPENQRVINHVIVFGPSYDPNRPNSLLSGSARSSTSQSTYGYRWKYFNEPSLASKQLLNDRAAAILYETKSEYWTAVVAVPGHRTLLPGRQVTLNLSNYGIDGTNFPNTYLVQETRDVFERGYWTRNLTLREYLS